MYSAPNELFASESADVLQLPDNVQVLVLESSSNSTVSSMVAPVSPSALISNNNQIENAPQYQVTVVPDGHTNAFLVRRVPEPNNGNSDYRSPTLFQSSRQSGRNLVMSSNENNCRKARSDYEIQHNGHGRKYLLADSFIEGLRQTKSTSAKFENVDQSNPLLMFLRKFDENRKCADTNSTCNHRSNASMKLKKNIIPIIPVKSVNHPSSSGNRQPCFVKKYLRKSKLMLQDHANVIPGFTQLTNLRCLPNGNRKPFAFKSPFNRIKYRSYNRQCSGYDSDCNDPDAPENESNEQNENRPCHQDCPYSNQQENNYDDSAAQTPPAPPPEENLEYSCPCQGEYQPQMEYEEECPCYDHQAYNDMVQPVRSPYQSRVTSRNQSIHNQTSNQAAHIQYNYCTVETCRSPRQSRVASRHQSIHSQQTSSVVPIYYNYCTDETCQNFGQNRAPSRNQSIHSQSPAAQNQYYNCTAETCQNQSRHSRVPSRNQSIHSQPPILDVAHDQCLACSRETCQTQRQSRVGSKNQSMHSQPSKGPSADTTRDPNVLPEDFNEDRDSQMLTSSRRSTTSKVYALPNLQTQDCDCNYYAERDQYEENRDPTVMSPQRNATKEGNNTNNVQRDEYDDIQEPCNSKNCDNYRVDQRDLSRQRNTTQVCNCATYAQSDKYEDIQEPCNRKTCITQGVAHHHVERTLQGPTSACNCGNYVQSDEYDEIDEPCNGNTCNLNKYQAEEGDQYDDFREPCNRNTCNQPVSQSPKNPRRSTSSKSSSQRVGATQNYEYVESNQYESHDPCNRNTCNSSRYQAVSNQQITTQQRSKSCHRENCYDSQDSRHQDQPYLHVSQQQSMQVSSSYKDGRVCTCRRSTYMEDNQGNDTQLNTTQKKQTGHETCNKRSCMFKSSKGKNSQNQQSESKSCRKNNCIFRSKRSRAQKQNNNPSYPVNQNFSVGCVSTMNQPMYQPINQPMYQPMNQPMYQPMNQPMNQPIHQPMNQLMNQPMYQNQQLSQPCNQNSASFGMRSNNQMYQDNQNNYKFYCKNGPEEMQQKDLQACNNSTCSPNKYDSQTTKGEKGTKSNKKSISASQALTNKISDRFNKVRNRLFKGNKSKKQAEVICESDCGIAEQKNTATTCCKDPDTIVCVSNDENKNTRSTVISECPNYDKNKDIRSNAISDCPFIECEDKLSENNCICSDSDNSDDEIKLKANKQDCKWREEKLMNDNASLMECECSEEELYTECICSDSETPEENKIKKGNKSKKELGTSSERKGTKQNLKQLDCECSSSNYDLQHKLKGNMKSKNQDFKSKETRSNKNSGNLKECVCSEKEKECACSDAESLEQTDVNTNRKLKGEDFRNEKSKKRISKSEETRSNNASGKLKECVCSEEEIIKKACVCSDSDSQDLRENNTERKLQGKDFCDTKSSKRTSKPKETRSNNVSRKLKECVCSEEEIIESDTESQDQRDVIRKRRDSKSKNITSNNVFRKLKETDTSEEELVESKCVCSDSESHDQKDMGKNKRVSKSKEKSSNNVFRKLKEDESSGGEILKSKCVCSDSESQGHRNVVKKRSGLKSKEMRSNNVFKKRKQDENSDGQLLKSKCICSDVDSQDLRETNTESQLQGKDFCETKSSKRIPNPNETRSNNVFRKLKEDDSSGEELLKSECASSDTKTHDKRDVVRKRQVSKSKETKSNNVFRKLKEDKSSEEELTENECICSDAETLDQTDSNIENKLKGEDFCNKKKIRVCKWNETICKNDSQNINEEEDSAVKSIKKECICSDVRSIDSETGDDKKRKLIVEAFCDKKKKTSEVLNQTVKSIKKECICSDLGPDDSETGNDNKRKLKGEAFCDKTKKTSEDLNQTVKSIQKECICSDLGPNDSETGDDKKRKLKGEAFCDRTKKTSEDLNQTVKSIQKECICSDLGPNDSQTGDDNKRKLNGEAFCDKKKKNRQDIKQDTNYICKERLSPKLSNESDISEGKSSNYKTTTSEEANCEDPLKENANGVVKGSDFCDDAIKRSSKSGEYGPLPKNDENKFDSCICSDFSRRSSKSVVYKATEDEISDFKKRRSAEDCECEDTSPKKQSLSEDSLTQTPRVLKGKDFCENEPFTIVDKVFKEKQKKDYGKSNCKYTGEDSESEQSEHKLKGKVFCTENMSTNDNFEKCKSFRNEKIKDNTDELILKCKQTNDQSEKCGCVYDVEYSKKLHKETSAYNSECDEPCNGKLENDIVDNDASKKSNTSECKDICSRKSDAQKKCDTCELCNRTDLDRNSDEKLLGSDVCEKKIDSCKCHDSPSMDVDISNKPKGNIVPRDFQIEESDSFRCVDSQSKSKQNTFNEDNFECLEEKTETDGWLRASDFCDDQSDCRRCLDLQSKPNISRKDEESCKCQKQDIKSESKLKVSDFYNGITKARYEVDSCICSDLTLHSEHMTKDSYSYSDSKGKLKANEFCECESNGRQKKRPSKTKQITSDDDFCKCGTSAGAKFGEFYSCDSDNMNDSDVCKCYDLPIKSESNRSQKNKKSSHKSDRSKQMDDKSKCRTPSKSKESGLCECYLPLKKKSSLKTQRKSCECDDDDDAAGQKSAKGQKIVIVCEEKKRTNSNTDKNCVRKLSCTKQNSSSSSSSCCSCPPINSNARNVKRSGSSIDAGKEHDDKQKRKRKLSTDEDDTSRDEKHCRPRAKSGSCNNEFRDLRSGEFFGRPPTSNIYPRCELPMQRMEDANHMQSSISHCNEIHSQRHADNQLPKIKIECCIVKCESTPSKVRISDGTKLKMNNCRPISKEQCCKFNHNSNQRLPCPLSRSQLQVSEHCVCPNLMTLSSANSCRMKPRTQSTYNDIVSNNRHSQRKKNIESRKKDNSIVFHCSIGNLSKVQTENDEDHNNRFNHCSRNMTKKGNHDCTYAGQSNSRTQSSERNFEKRCHSNGRLSKPGSQCCCALTSESSSDNDDKRFQHLNNNRTCNTTRATGSKSSFRKTNFNSKRNKRAYSNCVPSRDTISSCVPNQEDSSEDSESKSGTESYCNPVECFRSKKASFDKDDRSRSSDTNNDSDKGKVCHFCNDLKNDQYKSDSCSDDYSGSRGSCDECCCSSSTSVASSYDNRDFGGHTIQARKCLNNTKMCTKCAQNTKLGSEMFNTKNPVKCGRKTTKNRSPEYPTEYKHTSAVIKQSCRSLGGYCNNRRRRRARNDQRASRSASDNEIVELLTPVSTNREVTVIYVNTKWVNNTSCHTISENFEPSCTNKAYNKKDTPGPSSPN